MVLCVRLTALLASLAALAFATLAIAKGAEDPPASSASGAALYDRFCLACHGAKGGGEGPAAPWLWPRPRDFRSGSYKWRSTASGLPPTDEDLTRVIRRGAQGTSMHAFGEILAPAQVAALVDHLKTFAPRKFQRVAEPVVWSRPPLGAEVARRGKSLYTELGCAQCHGAEGRGDGPSSRELVDDKGRPAQPYDLTTTPLRRPRNPGEDAVDGIFLSLWTGLAGAPMPAYEGAAPADDVWAVAAYVDSIRAPDPAPALNNDSRIPGLAAASKPRGKRHGGGYYPGSEEPADALILGGAILPQGERPAALTPAQASPSARQCARCHAAQYRQWQGSMHAAAASPGLIAQLLALESPENGRKLQSCQRCHAPLAEQSPLLSAEQWPQLSGSFAPNPLYDEGLRGEGLNCASCHVRGHKRFGPPRAPGDKLLALPGYPLEELALYERSDFCLPCHQLEPSTGIAGKPLLNTYKEWLEGPYMRRGVQCQHCHMPSREHSWKGVHDPDTFRQGIAIESIAGRSTRGTVTVRARVTNVGAGHYLPTTPTPAAFVSIELFDHRDQPIAGARIEKRIGRHLVYQGRWRELEDTRIPPGESIEVVGAWKDGRVADASYAKVVVRVEPDEYYERFYRRRLRSTLTPDQRALFEEALQRTLDSHYVATSRRIPVPTP